MTCDTCGYQRVAHNGYCPICAQNERRAKSHPIGTYPEKPVPELEYAPPAPPAPQPGDKPSFLMAFVGFLVPIAGLVLYLVMRATTPLRARSAGRGALLSVAVDILAILWFFGAGYMEHAQKEAPRWTCRDRLQQLSVATRQYTRDHNEKYPDLSSPATIRAALDPYVSDKSIFACPATHEAYRGNGTLSHTTVSDHMLSQHTELFYEPSQYSAHPGGCNIAYADWSVRWQSVSEPRWRVYSAPPR